MIEWLASLTPVEWGLIAALVGAVVVAGYLLYLGTFKDRDVSGAWPWFWRIATVVLGGLGLASVVQKRRDPTPGPALPVEPPTDHDAEVLAIERETATEAADVRATDTSGMSTADVRRMLDGEA